jgi:hypothetical protein
MSNMESRPRGRLRLCVRDGDGKLIEERRSRNIILRQGAAVIANLFAAQAGAVGINTMQVGFGKEGATAETTVLVPPADSSIPVSALSSAIAEGDFSIVTDKPDAIQVMVSSVFTPTVELANVTEAGLLAGDKLYNQVVFEPVTLRPGQDVTFFWEIDFPFGH